MAEYEVRGGGALRALAAQVKAAGDVELRKDLLRGIRAAAKPLTASVRAAARESLPRKGGLNEAIAKSKIASRTRTTGKLVGVTFVGTWSGHDLEEIDQGRLRHPVFGHRDRWVSQTVQGGWWSDTLTRQAPVVQVAISGVLDEVARRLDGV